MSQLCNFGPEGMYGKRYWKNNEIFLGIIFLESEIID